MQIEIVVNAVEYRILVEQCAVKHADYINNYKIKKYILLIFVKNNIDLLHGYNLITDLNYK